MKTRAANRQITHMLVLFEQTFRKAIRNKSMSFVPVSYRQADRAFCHLLFFMAIAFLFDFIIR